MIRAREPVTKPVTKHPRVTKCAVLFTETPDDPIGLLKAMIAAKRPGRPRLYPTAAAKQKAYRARRKVAQ